jgi:hypothetical protein
MLQHCTSARSDKWFESTAVQMPNCTKNAKGFHILEIFNKEEN